jgi:hypothetical protein
VQDPYARFYDPEQPENVLAFSAGPTERDREALITW